MEAARSPGYAGDMRHVLRCLVILLGLVRLGEAVTATDFQVLSETNGSLTTPFRYYEPAGITPGTSVPLIVFLHGHGERGTDNTAQLYNRCHGAWALIEGANAASQSCAFLAPQCTTSVGWDNDARVDQTVAIIDGLVAARPVDTDRIYLTGISGGGGGTFKFLARHPTRFAAAMPMSGWGSGNYAAFRDLPLWCFHALNDGTVGIAGSDNAISGLRNAGGDPIYTRYDLGGHAIWTPAYQTPPLFAWMVAQRRGAFQQRAPQITLTAPVASGTVTLASATVDVMGTASDAAAPTAISWWYGDGGTALATGAASSGTTAWTIDNLPLTVGSHRLRVTGSGTSWKSDWAGTTTFSQSITVLRVTGSDTIAPLVSVTAPGSATTIQADTLAISGTASDNLGIASVGWQSDHGASGSTTGTTTWTAPALVVPLGTTVFTITALDAAGNAGSATVSVTRTSPGGTGGDSSSSASGSGGGGCGAGTGLAVLLAGLAWRGRRRR